MGQVSNVNSQVSYNTTHLIEGAGPITADGVDLGTFEGGIRLTVANTESAIRSDYTLGDVKIEKTGIDVTVETEISDAVLENLAICLGIHSSSVTSNASSKTLNLTADIPVEEIELVFKGMSAEDNTKVRTFTLHRAVRIGSTTVPSQKGVMTTYPVTFKALLNASGEFGTIVDSIV